MTIKHIPRFLYTIVFSYQIEIAPRLKKETGPLSANSQRPELG